MLHLKARSPQGCNIIPTSPLGWGWSQSMIPIPASPMLHLSDHWVGSRDESKSFEIIFVGVWDNISTYTLDPSWVIISLRQICHPYTNACRQLVAHCVSNSNCRLWRNLRTSEHISRLECIICSNILYLLSVLIIGEYLYNIVVAILRCRQLMESFIQFLWSSGFVMVSLMGLWRITFCSVSEARIFSFVLLIIACICFVW